MKAQDERVALAKEIRSLADSLTENDKTRDFSAEEQEKWDSLNARYDALGVQMEREERLAKLEADNEARTADLRGFSTGNGAESADHNAAIATWCRAQAGADVSEEEAANAKACGFNLHKREAAIHLSGKAEQRAPATLAIGAGATGGTTIAEGFLPRLERALLAFGNVRGVSTVIRTQTGASLPMPTVNDTTNKGAIVAEANTAATAQADPEMQFGSVTLDAYKYSSRLVKISAELLEDSEFDLASFLGAALGERLARIGNEHFTVGTGTAQPNGVVTASAAGVTAGSATVIDDDDLVDLFHSLDPAYRANARWMFADGVASKLRKIKDADGNSIWQPGLTAGNPDMILGKPVTINQDMDGVPATGDPVILFGDFSKYHVREVREIRMRRLVERYADEDVEGFVAFMRTDADLLDAGTNPIVRLNMA